MVSKTSFAIGCLVQWYEVDIIKEYVDSLKSALQNYTGQVHVDMRLIMNQQLEKTTMSEDEFQSIERKVHNMFTDLQQYCNGGLVTIGTHRNIYTIADYRREFNDYFCDYADVLIWGESDMLLPKPMFVVLDSLHQSQSTQTPKYLATFSGCKMWDDSWKPLEHVDFTDKPFIENDYDNWWSVKYTMSQEEMNAINEKVEELEVCVIAPHKFNGCGLVISSEIIKAGVNIPRSVFFVHEDTSFMLMTQKILGNIPQYHFRNILLVHNRNHPNKRMYVKEEVGDTLNQKRRSNEWYVKANKYCEENCYNIFNPAYKAKTWKDVLQ